MRPSLFGFAYNKKALAYLQKLPKKTRRQIVSKILALAKDPTPKGVAVVQGMSDGEERVYRERSGDYRILYVIRDPTITILDIDHRKDVYRGT